MTPGASSFLYDGFGVNLQMFYWLNGLHAPGWDAAMVLGSRLGSFFNAAWIFAGLLGVQTWHRWAPQRHQVAWLPHRHAVGRWLLVFGLAYGLAAVLVSLLKWGFDMPRPFMVLPEGSVHRLMEPESLHSFPSGHATFAMLVAVVFWPTAQVRWHGAWRALLLLGVAWVGVSRVGVGVHFPADVLAGCLCGLVCGGLARHVVSPSPAAKGLVRWAPSTPAERHHRRLR